MFFIYINNNLCNNTESMGNLYLKYQDQDEFLYIVYSGENTFG